MSHSIMSKLQELEHVCNEATEKVQPNAKFIEVTRTEMPRLILAVKKLIEQRDHLVRDFEVSQTLFYEDNTGERLNTEKEVQQEISTLNSEIDAILKGEK